MSVITLDKDSKQKVTLDVMPLSPGFLNPPAVKLARYIPAIKKDSSGQEASGPQYKSFHTGEVYNASESRQFHILPAPSHDA